jgi:hypothetical protein
MEHFYDKKWIRNQFLNYMGELMMEREKMLLPDTQDEARLVRKIKELSEEIQLLPTHNKIERLYKRDPVLLEEKKNEKREISDKLRNEINKLKEQTITYMGTKKKIIHEKQIYILKCPAESCRGFITKDYICATCDINICDLCHKIKDTNHKCDKDDIKSAELVQRETKPCPKCMTPIFKNGGCDQIFCTQCQTAFSWNTGIIEKGAIHNPHYYEWMANNHQNINIEEVACGELPNINVLIAFSKNLEDRHFILIMHRMVIHIQDVLLPEFTTDRVKDNFDLRVQFLLKEFDEEKWVMKLVNREKKRMKIKAIHDLLQLMITILTDFIRQYIYNSITIQSLRPQYNKLKIYYVENMNKIIDIHGGAIPTVLTVLF